MVKVVQTRMTAAGLLTPSKVIKEMEAERKEKDFSVSKFVLETVKQHATKRKKATATAEDAEAQDDDGGDGDVAE